VQSESVNLLDVGTQMDGVSSKEKGVQSPPSLLRELIPMSASAIGRLVVENPHEGSQGIMRRVQADHGALGGMAHTLTLMVVTAAIAGSAALADHLRQAANRPFRREAEVVVETLEERTQELWGVLSEHVPRD
jgi:hypothetical protein